MDYKFAVAVAFLGVLVPVFCQQTASQCQRTFLSNAMNCVQNASINFLNLQFLNTNGSKGQRPQENIAQFKMRACRVRPQVDQCGNLVFNQLVNSTLCLNALDATQLRQSAKEIFGFYDITCAHPCRYTLLNNIRQCFTYNNLDPRTFVDTAWGQGAIIGTNHEQVYKFCSNRQRLLQCIRQKVQMCPDSQSVFHKMGMDVMSMEKGIEALCHNPKVYLDGLGCFNNPAPEVYQCIQTGQMQMMNHKTQLQMTLNDYQFKLSTCSTRLQQASCELGAWARRKYDRCNKAIIGLRNELECKVLPSMCMQLNPHLFQRLCNPMNFHLDDRARYSSAGTIVVTWSTVAILVLVAIFSRA